MTEEHPERERVGASGTAVGWSFVRSEGDRGWFTKDEVRQALEKLGIQDAQREADALYEGGPDADYFFEDKMLCALASLSDDLHERVRLLFRETPAEAADRMARFSRSLNEHKRAGEGG